MKTCKKENCSKPVKASMLCGAHWKSWRESSEFEYTRKPHGMSRSPEYQAWQGMKHRCYDPKAKKYENYGGRGIKVCDRWLEKFLNFYDDMGRRPDDRHSLDRIDPNGDYTPENCRWASTNMQSFNQRKRKTNKSGHVGVRKTYTNTWEARICFNYKIEILGSFRTLDEAIAARKAAEKRYMKEFLK